MVACLGSCYHSLFYSLFLLNTGLETVVCYSCGRDVSLLSGLFQNKISPTPHPWVQRFLDSLILRISPHRQPPWGLLNDEVSWWASGLSQRQILERNVSILPDYIIAALRQLVGVVRSGRNSILYSLRAASYTTLAHSHSTSKYFCSSLTLTPTRGMLRPRYRFRSTCRKFGGRMYSYW